jgi:hypothetical protein
MKKAILWSIAGFAFLLVLGMALDLGGVKWMGFIEPKRQNVQRQVFENTQSYVHGKTQDLAKYYEQYQKADNPEKAVPTSATLNVYFTVRSNGCIDLYNYTNNKKEQEKYFKTLGVDGTKYTLSITVPIPASRPIVTLKPIVIP